MALSNEPDSGNPKGPGRRRALIIGFVLALLILVALAWFMVTHTDTGEQGGSLIGHGARTIITRQA